MGHTSGGGADLLKAKAALSGNGLLGLVDAGQQTIRCNFTPLAADVAGELGRRLVERGAVRSLDLCYCDLGAAGLEALTSALATRPSGLQRLSLGANALTHRGAVSAVALATGLRRLDLEINDLGDEGCKLISQKVLLRVSCTLQHLDLGMNAIGAEGATALASALRSNLALTRLDLGYNRIGSDGAEALAQALSTNSSLQVLRLEDNAVGDLGAAALVAGAGRLRELELAFNQVRAEGAVAISAALRTHSCLVRLGLEGNELRDAGASALAAAIQKNCCLEDLALRSNVIGSAGGAALAQALRGNWRLTALDVADNAVTAEAAMGIAETTRQSRVVRDEALRPPSGRELAEGTGRRFPTAWSVRAWLGWMLEDASTKPADLKTRVAAAHAAAVITPEAEVLSYDLGRLRDLATLYGRRLTAPGRLAPAKGVYMLNLTPFGVQVTAGKGSKAVHLKENSGNPLPETASPLRLTLSASKDSPPWLPQSLAPLVVSPVVGEQSLSLEDAGELRVLCSRWLGDDKAYAQLITLLWSWPQRLRGMRFHDLSFWWQGARGGVMQGAPMDVKSAIAVAVKPDTALAQCSLAELYNPGPVQTFVSHHWSQDVDELFKSLSHCSMRSENTRLWVCAFSNNHWAPQQRDHEMLLLPSDALASRSCQCFALVLGADAQSLRRLWCLHEVMLAAQVRSAGRTMSLKLCSPQGLLTEGTGGMPIGYILKVSAAISTLDIQAAECESGSEKELLLASMARHAGSLAAASSFCRQLLEEGLSVMHQRGQQIFVQAVSWLNDSKELAKGERLLGPAPGNAEGGDGGADTPEMETQEDGPRADSQTSSSTSSRSSSNTSSCSGASSRKAEPSPVNGEVEAEAPCEPSSGPSPFVEAEAHEEARDEDLNEALDEDLGEGEDLKEDLEEEVDEDLDEESSQSNAVAAERQTSDESSQSVNVQGCPGRQSSDESSLSENVQGRPGRQSSDESSHRESIDGASDVPAETSPHEEGERRDSVSERRDSVEGDSDESLEEALPEEAEEAPKREAAQAVQPLQKRKASEADRQAVLVRKVSEGSHSSLEDEGAAAAVQAKPAFGQEVRVEPGKTVLSPTPTEASCESAQVPAALPQGEGLQAIPGVVSVEAPQMTRAYLAPPGQLRLPPSRVAYESDSRRLPQADVESSRPNESEMDEEGLCKSPSFSPDPDIVSCFSFGDTREKAGYMAAASASLDHEYSPETSAWREEHLHFTHPAPLCPPVWPPVAPQLQHLMGRLPTDPRELADTMALTVMSSSFSRGVSLDFSPDHSEALSPKGGFSFSRGVSLEQEVNLHRQRSGGSVPESEGEDALLALSKSASFARGFSEDDLAATLLRAFQALKVVRLPLRSLLIALGRSDDEAVALEMALLPHLPRSEDGCIGCDELIQWLAMPK